MQQEKKAKENLKEHAQFNETTCKEKESLLQSEVEHDVTMSKWPRENFL